MFRLFPLAAGLLFASAIHADPWPRHLPDPCVNVRDRGPLNSTDFPNPALTDFWDVAYPDAFTGSEPSLRGVVFIVNANGASEGHYREIGEHLARQNFLVRLIKRPGATFAVADVEDDMLDTFAHFGLPEDFPVVLIGHSKGGGSVMEVTRQFSWSYNIDAVINIAPNVEGIMGILGTDAPAFLALYGSQDEDMQGVSGDPREAFMAYDFANGEWTTASPANPWVVVTPNMMDKAMVYVRGADHSGFIGHEGLLAPTAHQDYLAVDDQLCIGKAYVTAFLDWKLGGEAGYRAMFRGDIVPASVAGIATDKADNFGNAAGQPVELFHQYSPRKRFVIADFWNTPAMAVGIDMEAAVLYPFSQDVKARHETKALRLAWKQSPFMRHLTLSVPGNRRNLAAFDRFQFRIGQINTGNGLFANTDQQEPPMLVTLVDGAGQSAHAFVHAYGRIPGHDRRPGGGTGHSHMNTVSIPMDDLDSIDLGDVRLIRFWVYPQTRGEVMIDNIEAVYD